MLLLFRTIRVLFFALVGRKLAVDGESRLTLRVWPNDCDLNVHLNDGRYVSLMGLGRVDLLTRSGLLRQARKRGWFPVIGGATIRYRRSLLPFERFTLRTRVAAWDAKWVYIEHLFERRDGSIAASAFVRGVLRNKSGPIPTAEVLASIGSSADSPPIPEAVRKWNEVEL